METWAAKRRRLASGLEASCTEGNLRALQEAVDLGVVRADGNAAVIAACENGHVEVLDLLLSAFFHVPCTESKSIVVSMHGALTSCRKPGKMIVTHPSFLLVPSIRS